MSTDRFPPHPDMRSGGHPEVLAALERLPPAEREAIRLAVWEDLPVRDIARVLDCSPTRCRLSDGQLTALATDPEFAR